MDVAPPQKTKPPNPPPLLWGDENYGVAKGRGEGRGDLCWFAAVVSKTTSSEGEVLLEKGVKTLRRRNWSSQGGPRKRDASCRETGTSARETHPSQVEKGQIGGKRVRQDTEGVEQGLSCEKDGGVGRREGTGGREGPWSFLMS